MNPIFRRVSIRKYKDRLVEREKIELLLRAAMAAPSAKNRQPWEFYVISRTETLRALATASEYSICVGAAPLAIVPCIRQLDHGNSTHALLDLSAATENLLLEAVHLGLGAVWLGVAPRLEIMENVRRILDIPENLSPFAIVPIGYPAAEKMPKERYDPTRIHWV